MKDIRIPPTQAQRAEGDLATSRAPRRAEDENALRSFAARLFPILSVTALVVAVVCICGAMLAFGAGEARGPVNVPTVAISVASGDSLWAISERHPIEGLSTQECVAWIMAENGLDSARLVPGQVIEVPIS